MADQKISQLTSATTPLAGTEELPIVQSGATKKVPNNDLRPKQIQSNATTGVLQVAGPGTNQTRIMTTPDANFTVARTDAAQTFTGDQTFSNVVLASAGSQGAPAVAANGDADTGLYFPATNQVALSAGNNTGILLESDFTLRRTPRYYEYIREISSGNNVTAYDINITFGSQANEITGFRVELDYITLNRTSSTSTVYGGKAIYVVGTFNSVAATEVSDVGSGTSVASSVVGMVLTLKITTTTANAIMATVKIYGAGNTTRVSQAWPTSLTLLEA